MTPPPAGSGTLTRPRPVSGRTGTPQRTPSRPSTPTTPPSTPPRRRTAPQPPRRPGRPARQAVPPRRPRPRRGLTLGRGERRLTVGFVVIAVLLLIVGGRLVWLQGVDTGGYAGAAAAQRIDTVALHALRGTILDRNGTVLAYTTSAQDITVDPSQVPADKRTSYALTLSGLLDRPADAIAAVLAQPGKYAVLARAQSPMVAKQIEDADLHGVYTQPTTAREYPARTTAANIVGVVHSDGSGAAGVEDSYQDVLAGKDGSVTYATDNQGNMSPSGPDARHPAQNGGAVTLTIDQDLQYMVQQALQSAVQQSGAKGAQAAVLDARTGEVLALASNTTFDPADPSTIGPDTQLDAPIQTVFEPGSVNKVVTFSAAIEKGLVAPDTQLQVPGALATGGVVVHDDWAHPTQTFTATGVLAQSSNVGTLELADKLGGQTWYDYEQKFGIGAPTGIELPGESSGLLPDPAHWSDSSFANLPIGQGVAMTVLQMASMYQTIANDGVRIPPRIVATVTGSDGKADPTLRPAGVRVVSPRTAQTVRTMLESVTLPGGTGTKAAIPGYRVAGKTGTAQQPDPAHNGAYSTWMNWDTFTGMVPADKPQFVVAIMVDNPAHGLHGGDVAAPLFHDIASYELQHAHVPPTGSQSVHVPLLVCDDTIRRFYGSTVC